MKEKDYSVATFMTKVPATCTHPTLPNSTTLSRPISALPYLPYPTPPFPTDPNPSPLLLTPRYID